MKKIENLIYYFSILLFFQNINAQNDCVDALFACGNGAYNNLTIQGFGNINELSGNQACQDTRESNSIWFKVIVKTGGTLGFTLTPQNTDIEVDFDWHIFGPNATCSNLGPSLRCSTTNPSEAGLPNNLTGMNDTEIDEYEGPGPNGSSFVKWLTVKDGETYFLLINRFTGESGFSLAWNGTATFNDTPVVNNTTGGNTLNIESCDNDNNLDNITVFDLTKNTPLALGTQTGVTASYHLSENDALTGKNPIASPERFQNTTNPQTVYIRLENTAGKCFATAPFQISIIPFNVQNPTNLEKCDDNFDGFFTFDLTENNATITNGNADIDVTYHPTNSDAVLLPNSYTNKTAFTKETLWAKIRNRVTGCFVYKAFDIIVNKLPAAIPAQLTQCDSDNTTDGISLFNLAEVIPLVTNNDPNITAQFFLNATDAENNTGALPNNYTNISNPQILSIRLTNNTTKCYSISQLTLNIIINPVKTVDLNACDDDGTVDGYKLFNLADAGFEVPGFTVKYYFNLNDAQLEQNPITNFLLNSQTVYARVESGNDCVVINTINLIVNPVPVFDIENKEILCLNLPDKPVKLTAIVTDPTLYSYKWIPNGETTQSINVNKPGVYAVEVRNIATTCVSTLSTEVVGYDIAVLGEPTIIDNGETFTVIVNVVTNGNYVYCLDDPDGICQDSNTFDNVSPGMHTFYVKEKNGCGIVSTKVTLFSIPNFFTPNNDGIHDFWNVKGISDQTTTYIFNRYGKLLKQILPLEQGWNGMYNGNEAIADDYWYNIILADGKNYKGHFTLKR